jgi:hypothetical protein
VAANQPQFYDMQQDLSHQLLQVGVNALSNGLRKNEPLWATSKS